MPLRIRRNESGGVTQVEIELQLTDRVYNNPWNTTPTSPEVITKRVTFTPELDRQSEEQILEIFENQGFQKRVIIGVRLGDADETTLTQEDVATALKNIVGYAPEDVLLALIVSTSPSESVSDTLRRVAHKAALQHVGKEKLKTLGIYSIADGYETSTAELMSRALNSGVVDEVVTAVEGIAAAHLQFLVGLSWIENHGTISLPKNITHPQLVEFSQRVVNRGTSDFGAFSTGDNFSVQTAVETEIVLSLLSKIVEIYGQSDKVVNHILDAVEKNQHMSLPLIFVKLMGHHDYEALYSSSFDYIKSLSPKQGNFSYKTVEFMVGASASLSGENVDPSVADALFGYSETFSDSGINEVNGLSPQDVISL